MESSADAIAAPQVSDHRTNVFDCSVYLTGMHLDVTKGFSTAFYFNFPNAPVNDTLNAHPT